MTGLPPSPGLAFQLAKHRYSREDMLGIFENIEKKLLNQPPPPVFNTDFEDLFRKEIQRPTLLSPPSLEEQVQIFKLLLLAVTGPTWYRWTRPTSLFFCRYASYLLFKFYCFSKWDALTVPLVICLIKTINENIYKN
jgi:hypothetical protein